MSLQSLLFQIWMCTLCICKCVLAVAIIRPNCLELPAKRIFWRENTSKIPLKRKYWNSHLEDARLKKWQHSFMLVIRNRLKTKLFIFIISMPITRLNRFWYTTGLTISKYYRIWLLNQNKHFKHLVLLKMKLDFDKETNHGILFYHHILKIQ